MIEIKCVDDRLTEDEEELVLAMTDRSCVLGQARLCITGDTVSLCACEAPDTALTDALFRAALNTASSKGAVWAVSACDTVTAHMTKKSYTADLTDGRLEIDKFFSKFVCKG